MPVAWIPSLLRDLTAGEATVPVQGATVREVIEALESRFPGIKERLCEGDRLRPTIAVIVDGQVSRLRLRQPLEESSEVHFVPAISGGRAGSQWRARQTEVRSRRDSIQKG